MLLLAVFAADEQSNMASSEKEPTGDAATGLQEPPPPDDRVERLDVVRHCMCAGIAPKGPGRRGPVADPDPGIELPPLKARLNIIMVADRL